jgi:hypothetical protein
MKIFTRARAFCTTINQTILVFTTLDATRFDAARRRSTLDATERSRPIDTEPTRSIETTRRRSSFVVRPGADSLCSVPDLYV